MATEIAARSMLHMNAAPAARATTVYQGEATAAAAGSRGGSGSTAAAPDAPSPVLCATGRRCGSCLEGAAGGARGALLLVLVVVPLAASGPPLGEAAAVVVAVRGRREERQRTSRSGAAPVLPLHGRWSAGRWLHASMEAEEFIMRRYASPRACVNEDAGGSDKTACSTHRVLLSSRVLSS